MNKPQHFKKIVIVISFIALCLGGAIFTNRFFNREIISQQTTKLANEIDLMIALMLKEKSDLQAFGKEDDLAYLIGKNERLTLLSKGGLIIYDSSHEKEAIGTRSKRPEVQAVLSGKASQGSALRESKTIGEKLLYVAKPIYRNGELIGVLRLSEKYTGFSDSIRQFQQVISVVFIILVGAIMFLLFYFIRQTNEPLRFVLPALQEAIDHPEKKQELDTSSAEWNQLYQSVNRLMRETNQLYYQQLFNEEKLQFLLESLNIGVFIMNSDLEIVSANPTMHQLFNPHEPLANGISYQLWFSDEEMQKLVERVKQEGQELQAEIHLQTPLEKDLNVVLRILQPDNQKQKEYVGIVYDITDIRQMELIHQDFISNISHELKTPTTSIIGFTETLLDGALNEKEVAKDFLEIIQSEANRLYGLIQNILLLLRTETSLAEKDIAFVSPVSIIEEEMARYQSKIESKELKVTLGLDDVTHKEVPSDYFQPVVKNLLENAVDYTENQGKIHISLRTKDQELIFSVMDTGVGISEEDQSRIFERFYRVSKSRQRNIGGSGLGLSIVSHYAKLLKGQIKLESSLGEGTKVSVNFPFK